MSSMPPLRGRAQALAGRFARLAPGESLRDPRILAAFASTALACFVAARWAGGFGIGLGQGTRVTPIWPAAGIAAGALLVTGGRVRAAAFAGSVLAFLAASLTAGAAIGAALVVTAGHAIELVLIVGIVLAIIEDTASFGRLRYLWSLLGAAFGGAIVAGLLVAFGLRLVGLPGADALAVWQMWTTSHALGVVVFAPPVVMVAAQRWRALLSSAILLECAAALLLLCVLAYAVLDRAPDANSITDLSPLSALLPVLIWIGMRLPPIYGAIAAALIAGFTVRGVTLGLGPFSSPAATIREHIWAAQLFILSSSICVLALSILSERRRVSEAALRDAVEGTQLAMSAGGMGTWSWDTVRDVIRWSPEMAAVFGRRPGDVPRDSSEFRALVHPDDADGLSSRIERALAGEDIFEADFRVLGSGGEPRWIYSRAHVKRRPDGRPEALVGVSMDISARKRTEAAYRESEARFRALTALSSDWYWEQDEELRFIDMSQGVKKLAGSSAGSHIGKRRWELPTVGVSEAEWARHRGQLDRREPFREFELRRVSEQGDIIWMSVSGDPVLDEAGRFKGYRGTGRNITARKNAEAALRESEERLRLSTEAAGIGTFAVDVEAGRARYSPELAAMLGFPGVENVRVEDAFARVHRDDVGRVRKQYAAAVDPHGDGRLRMELRFVRPGGKVRWMSFNGQVQFRDAPAGRVPLQIVGACVDITERKEAEETLARHRERLEIEVAQRTAELSALFDAVPDGIITTGIDRTIRTTNAAFDRMFGYARHELSGQSARVLYASEADTRKVAQAWKDWESSDRKQPEVVTCRRKDGSTFTALVIGNVVRDATGAVISRVGLGRDITEQLARERALQQSQKMEAIGQLTGGLTHDINNLLAIIAGNLELAMARIGDAKAREAIEHALDAVETGTGLNRRLLTFARRRRLEPVLLDVNAEVRDMTQLLTRTLGEQITLSTDLAEGLWGTRADPSEVESALLNLALNSRDAMPGGGVLAIRTGNVTVDQSLAADLPDVEPGEYVRISVSDTGTGMTPEVARRALEPFFTTKPTGKGTGLGLSGVYGFARQSGGHLTIYTEPGKGTIVNLYLPRAPADPGMRAAAVASDEVPMGNGELVLVVDDNEQVRDATLKRIESLGYAVLEAADGPSALRIIESGEPIAVVLSDIVMPGGMSGYDVASAVRTSKPEVGVLLTSGFNAEEASEGVHGEFKVLDKPISRIDLARALHDALPAAAA